MDMMGTLAPRLGNSKKRQHSKEPTSLSNFLCTLVTYPAFYVLATTPATPAQPGKGGIQQARFSRPEAKAAQLVTSAGATKQELGWIRGAESKGPSGGAFPAAIAPEMHPCFTGGQESSKHL